MGHVASNVKNNLSISECNETLFNREKIGQMKLDCIKTNLKITNFFDYVPYQL